MGNGKEKEGDITGTQPGSFEEHADEKGGSYGDGTENAEAETPGNRGIIPNRSYFDLTRGYREKTGKPVSAEFDLNNDPDHLE